MKEEKEEEEEKVAEPVKQEEEEEEEEGISLDAFLKQRGQVKQAAGRAAEGVKGVKVEELKE